jgi:hypothetical protein
MNAYSHDTIEAKKRGSRDCRVGETSENSVLEDKGGEMSHGDE